MPIPGLAFFFRLTSSIRLAILLSLMLTSSSFLPYTPLRAPLCVMYASSLISSDAGDSSRFEKGVQSGLHLSLEC
jgi:hypothetical protein